MSKPKDFSIDKLIEFLRGTCRTIEGALISLYDGEMTEEDLTDLDHNEIDCNIYLCETCDWWCEIGDQSYNGNCPDCTEDEECEVCGELYHPDDLEDEICGECSL